MKITLRMWIMILVVVFALISIFSIPPTFLEKGVNVASVEKNSTAFEQGLRAGMIITSINGNKISNLQDYSLFMNKFVNSFTSDSQTQKLVITTKTTEVIGLFTKNVTGDIVAANIPKTRIVTGLDLQGGVRALVKAANHSLTSSELQDLISVTEQRLNVYGLSDVTVRPRTDSSGNNFMSVEIAGSSPSDLENLISQQGKFEAKIGNNTVFIGGNKDITFVGRTGEDALITECVTVSQGETCTFRFVVFLSEEAAQRHADITKNLAVNQTSSGRYLNETIDFYIDGVKTSSLNIGEDLKGKVATQIQITGSEIGTTRKEAIENTQKEMNKLQTILKTGSLPFKLQIEKIDRISPTLGQSFLRAILLSGVLAAAGVFVVLFIRYRKIKISIINVVIMLSEILITLGVAALIGWNIDLAGIAGIIAAIGTGVDDQIVILDESTRSQTESLKQRIKAALFIVFTAYATTAVSLLPLLNAGAGLLKGFAFTTLVGITAGVFITRPAFGDIVRQLEEE